MTTERLQYIFNQIVNPRHLQVRYQSPWIYDDGRIYATDGYILLCLKNKDGRALAVKDDVTMRLNPMDGSSKFAAELIPPFGEKTLDAGSYVSIDELEGFEGFGELSGVILTEKTARKLARIFRLFGMDGVCFDVPEKNRLMFDILDSRGVTGKILCAGYDEKEVDATPLAYLDCHLLETLSGAFIGYEKGERYYRECLVQDEITKERVEKENFKVFKVTLVQSKTICVRADGEVDATRIALDNAYLLSFDGGEDVEECVESCKFDEEAYFDGYYTDKGKQNWEKGS